MAFTSNLATLAHCPLWIAKKQPRPLLSLVLVNLTTLLSGIWTRLLFTLLLLESHNGAHLHRMIPSYKGVRFFNDFEHAWNSQRSTSMTSIRFAHSGNRHSSSAVSFRSRQY